MLSPRVEPFTSGEVGALASRSSDFVLASTNVDEDIHFSTLYLESTLRPPESSWGLSGWFTELVAVNDQALERYYLLGDECLSVSTELSDLVWREPQILLAILHEIESRSGLLDTVFPFGWLSSKRRDRDRESLIEIYRRHLSIHQYLYDIARIPEALDRGHGIFTRRLLEFIESRDHSGLDPAEVLAAVSFAHRPSVFREEQAEFLSIIETLSDEERKAVVRARTGSLALMSLSSSQRSALSSHRAKWAPLFYHGYGHRETVPLSELASRLKHVLTKGVATLLPDQSTLGLQQDLLAGLALTTKETSLLYAYGLIGWTKARRRWFQLRNFQRLDVLMELIATDLNCSELELRSLLPIEVVTWLEQGIKPSVAIEARRDGVLYWLNRQELRVGALPAEFSLGAPINSSADRIVGQGIVSGIVTGRCVLGSRGGPPPPEEDVTGSAILVLAQLDSDLVWMLPFYAGLVVEESGASAHVSIIAREIGIPTVAGVADATRILASGESITVDGATGTVHRHQ